MHLNEAHHITKGAGVVVAVVDSGVDAGHPVLQGSILPGADFSDSDQESSGDGHIDLDGHGTGMASLIVGHGRIAGVAPAAKVLPVRVAGAAQRTNFAQGIRWAANHGANVISISSSAPMADPREKAAIDEATRKNIVVVAGVGNMPNSNSVQYPARYPGVIAVAATALDGSRSATSVTGPEVLLAAPGDHISLADLRHGFSLANGTSDSTALVSGVVALILSRFPGLSVEAVTRRLTDTADDTGPAGRDEDFGFGTVNLLAALTAQVPDHGALESGNAATKRRPGASSLAASNPTNSSSGLWYSVLLLLVSLVIAGVVIATIVVVRTKV